MLAVVAAGTIQLPAVARSRLEPVAVWRMDHIRSGHMPDLSGKGNVGYVHHVALVPGFRGHAYSFNGETSHVVVPSASSLNPARATFKVRVRVKFGTPPEKHHDYDLLRKGMAGTPNGFYKLEVTHRGRARCVMGGFLQTATLAKGPDLADGRWHTLKCLKTSRLVRLKIDGNAYECRAEVGHIWNGAALTLGFRKGGSDYYKGFMDDVRIGRG
jgi:hypothetical protein